MLVHPGWGEALLLRQVFHAAGDLARAVAAAGTPGRRSCMHERGPNAIPTDQRLAD